MGPEIFIYVLLVLALASGMNGGSSVETERRKARIRKERKGDGK